MQSTRAVPAIATAALLLQACGDVGSVGPQPDAARSAALSIAEVQGDGRRSPVEGSDVTVTGVVTGDFQGRGSGGSGNLDGFFLQSEIPDSDSRTSDGIFVFDGPNSRTDVSRGDRVRVRGEVVEHFGETQIMAADIRVIGSGTVTPITVTLPSQSIARNSDDAAIADLEAFEGMYVRFPQALTIRGMRELESFGAMALAAGGRPFQFTNRNAPDAAGYRAHRQALASRSIVLDDGFKARRVAPIRYLEASGFLRVGDTVTGLTGNLRYSRGSGDSGTETYRLMPTAPPEFASENPRPEPPPRSGPLRIASFNLLNFFSTIDTGRDVCGPFKDAACRGADSAAEFERQRAKVVTALRMIDADVVGLIEMENNADASLREIVDALNSGPGSDAYAYVETGTIGRDTIKTGFIYRTGQVAPQGSFALLDASVDVRFNDSRNRPALAQTFRHVSTGASLTVIVVHLKSKGSNCEADGDPNRRDGQGNCNGVRTDAAMALVDWLRDDPTGSRDDDYLVIGDFNAYAREDPIVTFEGAGYINLLRKRSGDAPYSFVFDGQSGALDHALASPALVPQITGAVEWHINADEAAALDYNLDRRRSSSLFDAGIPYRASDHDPLIVDVAPTR